MKYCDRIGGMHELKLLIYLLFYKNNRSILFDRNQNRPFAYNMWHKLNRSRIILYMGCPDFMSWLIPTWLVIYHSNKLHLNYLKSTMVNIGFDLTHWFYLGRNYVLKTYGKNSRFISYFDPYIIKNSNEYHLSTVTK